MKILKLFTDGAARGNPGPAGAGLVLLDDQDSIVFEGTKYLGTATNNQAEYTALQEGLKKALDLNCSVVQIFMDSELIVKQIKGEYRVKNEGLKPFYLDIVRMLKEFNSFSIQHIPRNENKLADKLANIAIDEAI